MNPRKILIVGSSNSFSLEMNYLRNIRSDVECHIFPARTLYYDYYNSGLINKLLVKLGLSVFYQRINIELLDYVKALKPDVVWVFKGMEIFPETLRTLSRMGVFLVNLNPDHPFKWAGSGSGNTYVKDSIELYDLHLCYHKEVEKQLREEYGQNTELVWFGYDLSMFGKIGYVDSINTEMACFVGFPDRWRAKQLSNLVKSGVPLVLYGDGWRKYFRESKDLILKPAVTGRDYFEVLNTYKVQLNVLRPHNYGAHNMRTFEIGAVGSLMVSTYSEDHASLNKEGVLNYLHNTDEEFLEQVIRALSLNKAEMIDMSSYIKTSLNFGEHTYRDRGRTVLNAINGLM